MIRLFHSAAVIVVISALHLTAQTSPQPAAVNQAENPSVAPSHPGSFPGIDPAKTQAIREQVRFWAQKELVPSLREWKSQLDGAMDNADLTALNLLRERATVLRRQSLVLMGQMRQAIASNDETKLGELRPQMRGIEKQHRQLKTELEPLVIKYTTTLKAIGEVARPKVKAWLESLRMRLQENAGGDFHFRPEYFRPEILDMGIGMMWGHPQAIHARFVGMFMLWDGSDISQLNAEPLLQNSPVINKVKTDNSFTLSQNTPNPITGGSTTFTFSLVQADRVKLTVIDEKGSQVAVVTESYYTAGDHYVEFPVGALANGTYIYRLECSQGTLTNTMTVLR